MASKKITGTTNGIKVGLNCRFLNYLTINVKERRECNDTNFKTFINIINDLNMLR